MKEIAITRGRIVLVDDGDYERLIRRKWQYLAKRDSGIGYAIRTDKINGKKCGVLMHREILGLPIGREPRVDHRDSNGLNNQKENLRIATQLENSRNRARGALNTSGYKGVCWHKRAKKWAVSIRYDGKRMHLGLFANKIAAAAVYDDAARKLFGEFAKCNFGK